MKTQLRHIYMQKYREWLQQQNYSIHSSEASVNPQNEF